ncbi:5-guanidino-2-oxopentanoate decarboxylase [Paracoccus sp. MBLB3053]|uniref:5-guanidino-2-oxopentanoate decarboxylase n=1 Tax=Paracoccus aurantius TaxID=3073814 RepID=A0ABU2HYJ5_9RHOB|nr:5-guanidino-2-oxopentanoate decarboxylase [Paracoccus sp. MBLB3053]MDS9470106.1 5-guanidino-2-oxopentanoate decarboxylase [Paracoccus sp. MBLB3053]
MVTAIPATPGLPAESRHETAMTVGEALPSLLEAHGIDTVFGIPGVHTVELYRGMANTSLRHVTPRHEQGAGFMADGYARASGRPAACFIISGPGMTNIATAMGQAYADSIPMLVISSVLNRNELGRGEGRLHELKNQSALVSGVSAFSHTVMSAEDLPAIIDRAAAVFNSARPRPVHIELPLDVIVEPAGRIALDRPQQISVPAPDAVAVARAAEWLGSARRPLVILGGGAVAAGDSARQMVEALGAPTLLTINAKGLLVPGHPLLVGSLLPQSPMLDELRDADVVLAVGTELGETDTLLFGARPRIDGRLIRVDIEAEQIMRNAQPALGIVADSRSFCPALIAALGDTPAPQTDRTAALRAKSLATVTPVYHTHGRILDLIASAYPDAIFAGDSTQPVYGGNLTYDAQRPRSWFNSSTGFGTLGYGLPAAMGAKLACPERPVIGLIGDGGLQFTVAEIASAVELGLSLPVIVWNNRGYGEIKTYMRDRGIPEIGVDILTPDFQMIARGFGAKATRVETPSALLEALAAAFSENGPTIIEIEDHVAQSWYQTA